MRERLSFAYDMLTVKGIYPAQYRKYAKQPVVPNKVILLEPRFRQTTDSLLQIKKRLEEIGCYDIVEISLGLGLLLELLFTLDGSGLNGLVRLTLFLLLGCTHS